MTTELDKAVSLGVRDTPMALPTRKNAITCPSPALLVILGLPIFLYLPEWLGWLSADPMHVASRVVTDPPPFTQGGILPGLPGWIDGCAGVIVEALGRLVARDWLSGTVPWWNPYSGVGMPLAGEYQGAAFFLPYVLLLGIPGGSPGGLLLMKCALQITAGLSMRALLRRLGLAPVAVLTGAILYECNGTFGWASDGPSQPLAFLPLALYGVERAREGRWGWLALGLAYLLLAGFPETAYLLGLLVLGWAVLRLIQQKGTRLRFAMTILTGGIAALLIAAPQLIAFATFLPHAYIGAHAGLNDGVLPAGCWAMLLFPYVNGTFFYGNQFDTWYAMGGYLGLALPFLALCAIGGQREAALRWLLLAYALAVLGKQGGVPVLTALVDRVPGAAHTVFYRLATPVTEAALILLACLAVDDLARRAPPRRLPVIAGILLALAACALVLDLDLPMQHALRVATPHLLTRLFAPLSIAAGLAAGVLAMFAVIRGRPRLAAGVVTAEAVLLFALPLLAARPAEPLATPLIAALQRETGPDGRFATLGPIEPNYGAALGIAELNYNGIPMPSALIDRLRRDFGADLDPVTFDGATPVGPNGQPFLLRPLIEDPSRLARLGVRAVLVPHGTDLTAILPRETAPGGAGAGTVLTPDHATLALPLAMHTRGELHGIALEIGTFRGASDGALTVLLCADTGQCVHGHAGLRGATDNAYLRIPLDSPLLGNVASLTISLTDATSGVMLWGTREAGAGFVPHLRLLRDRLPPGVVPVMTSTTGDLYRLADASPYFDAGPGCRLAVIDRTRLTASCNAPSALVRRELSLPGWSAWINGRKATPRVQDGLFQTIALPAGRSTVRFLFAPPGASAGWVACAIGLTLMALGFSPLANRRRRARD